MAHILNRTGKAFVILLSLLVASGCSEDPRQEADRAIEGANEEISAHDELHEEARGAYAEERRSVREDGEPDAGAQSFSEARETMEKARSRLRMAQQEISGIRELDVSGEVLEYSRILEDALGAQLEAEQREIAFYEILEEDPALERDRERAIGILAEAESAYNEAERKYDRAASVADSNPEMVAPESD